MLYSNNSGENIHSTENALTGDLLEFDKIQWLESYCTVMWTSELFRGKVPQVKKFSYILFVAHWVMWLSMQQIMATEIP